MPPYRESPSISSSSIDVLYEDNHVIAVFKPHRILIQSDQTGDVSLLDLTKDWLKKRYDKPGNVFLGLVHRLDRPAAGVVVFAKTSKAAARLSEQFRTRRVQKLYWAIVEGQFSKEGGRLENFLLWKEDRSVLDSAGKLSSLTYKVIDEKEKRSFLEIQLETGRKHQIRAQFSGIDHPLLGDRRYGAKQIYLEGAVALVAKEIAFEHPVRREETIVVRVPDSLCPLSAFWK